jgi:hypothetical protein
VWGGVYPGQRFRLRFAPADLALGYFLAAPTGAPETAASSSALEQAPGVAERLEPTAAGSSVCGYAGRFAAPRLCRRSGSGGCGSAIR